MSSLLGALDQWLDAADEQVGGQNDEVGTRGGMNGSKRPQGTDGGALAPRVATIERVQRDGSRVRERVEDSTPPRRPSAPRTVAEPSNGSSVELSERCAALERQLREAYAESASHRRRAEELRSELEALDGGALEEAERKFSEMERRCLEAERRLDELRGSSAASIRAARAEAEEARSEAATARASWLQREDELRGEVAELSDALTRSQRALEEAQSISGGEDRLEAVESAAKEASAAAMASAAIERRRAAGLERELGSARDMIKSMESSMLALRKETSSLRQELEATQRKMAAVEEEARLRGRAEVEAQAASRSTALRRALDDARRRWDKAVAERAALEQRLADAETANATLGIRRRAHDEYDQDDEYESNSTNFHDDDPKRKRTRPMNAKWAPKPVQSALAATDKCCLRAGAAIALSPLARMLIVLYIIVLHLWVLAVLAFHSHGIEEPRATAPGQRAVIYQDGMLVPAPRSIHDPADSLGM